MFSKRVFIAGTAGLSISLAFVAALGIFSGFTEDVSMARKERSLIFSSTFYSGLVSVEETILGADIVAVVEIESVSRGIQKHTFAGSSGYSKTIEFNLRVDEYLKGTGNDRIIGTVFSDGSFYNTAAGALLSPDPAKERTTRWDERRAIVFMDDDGGKDPEGNWEEGRYWLAVTYSKGDTFSVINDEYRPWLPAISEDPDEQTFLLESDLDPNVTPDTITLDELRARIAQLGEEVAGKTEEYKECVEAQYRWGREVDYRDSGGSYPYIREDVSIGSGAPSGTHILTGRIAPYVLLARQESPLLEGQEDRYVLVGNDQEYFVGTPPGLISLARPLPAGEYKTYHAHLPYDMGSLCSGSIPEVEMRRQELFVTVTAPAGTLHEAFFDPVEAGKEIAADSAIGVLDPAAFTDANGASATIQRIAWEAEAGGVGTVKLTLSPHNSIAGHTVEFIALDGSVPLSLPVAEAQVDETNGTLTWKVESQPWQSGDKLMLRVSAPVS